MSWDQLSPLCRAQTETPQHLLLRSQEALPQEPQQVSQEPPWPVLGHVAPATGSGPHAWSHHLGRVDLGDGEGRGLNQSPELPSP